ncbi:MAG: dihydroorotate dehydrogenase [Dermatophilaceae bacterium]
MLAVDLGPLALVNPVMPASGCFGPELSELIPLARLGALVTKTVFSGIRSGNPAHRLTETADGMLNAVGIPSLGKAGFIEHVLPGYLAPGVPLIISVGGLSLAEYWTVTEELADIPYAALEVNVSCPNLELGGLEIGTDPRQVEAVIRGVVKRCDRPVIAKLTPNVTRIDDIARAAEAGGAVAVTVANTFIGMAIDLGHRRPVLGNITGGLSGPAIKPLTLRLVWQVARAVDIPVIGCGGITDARDAVEFFIAGASAVQVGTATFTRPDSMIRILDDLPQLLDELGASSVQDLIGTLDVPSTTPHNRLDAAVHRDKECSTAGAPAEHGRDR